MKSEEAQRGQLAKGKLFSTTSRETSVAQSGCERETLNREQQSCYYMFSHWELFTRLFQDRQDSEMFTYITVWKYQS